MCVWLLTPYLLTDRDHNLRRAVSLMCYQLLNAMHCAWVFGQLHCHLIRLAVGLLYSYLMSVAEPLHEILISVAIDPLYSFLMSVAEPLYDHLISVAIDPLNSCSIRVDIKVRYCLFAPFGPLPLNARKYVRSYN